MNTKGLASILEKTPLPLALVRLSLLPPTFTNPRPKRAHFALEGDHTYYVFPLKSLSIQLMGKNIMITHYTSFQYMLYIP